MRAQVTDLDFTGQTIFAGIDVHKMSWTLTLETDDLVLKTFNQPADPMVLAKYLKRNYPGAEYLCGYESGFCGFWIQKELESLGVKCVVVHSADVPTTHKEKTYKRDPMDSRKLTRMLRTGDYTPLYIHSDIGMGNRSLLRVRKMLVNDLIRYKNRIKGFLNFYGIRFPESFQKSKTHWSKRFIVWLQELELDNAGTRTSLDYMLNQAIFLRQAELDVTKSIKALSEQNPYTELTKLLMSIPGIGLIGAMTILTEVENIHRFRNLDHFCSYCALVPTAHSSGNKEIAGRITKRGNKALKTILIEGAWVAVRHDPAMLMTYRKLLARMDKNKAIIRIARKLANRILFVMKNKQQYQNLKVN